MSDVKKINRPATFGGTGFRHRNTPMQKEIDDIWTQFGVGCEGDRLRQVVLAVPGLETQVVEPPNQWLMLGPVDLSKIQKQAEDIAKYFDSNGVKVHLIPSIEAKTPNWIFLRDLFWMTPEGAYLSRPASQQRAGEEKILQRFFSANDIPQIGMPRRGELFEGADAQWLNHHTILLGVGNRTNADWKNALAGDLTRGTGKTQQKIISGSLPEDVQHLLGVVNFVSPSRAAVWKNRTPQWVLDALIEASVEPITLPDIEEMRTLRAMNWVCMGPDWVVMPHDCPKIASILQQNGVRTDFLNISEYRNAGGALGCLTGIVERKG